jgi:multidrug efflux pump subunit AcrA (membrane-fusion protein)
MENPMKTSYRTILWAVLPALLFVGACRSKSAPEAGVPVGTEAHEAEAPASVTLSAQAVAAADLKTATAATRLVARLITAAGELEWNARRFVHLTARTPGRLERVLAVRGDRVREDQLLAEIYSPDYLTLQAEYIQAAARARRQAGNAGEEEPARAFLAGARERLVLLGVTAAEIDDLGARAVPKPLLAVRAPLSGTVLESGVVVGDAVGLGTSLFRLADPSTLWACLHIQEKDLAALKAGTDVILKTQAYPGEEFRGRLALIGDVIEPATRTIEGRVEVGNAAGKLKAGMYVEGAAAAAGERQALVVPEESVQDDLGKSIVFVKTGERTFVRREVVTGERFGGAVEILKGLEAGETVVTSGSFLLKSEIRKGGLEDDHGHD